MLRIRPPACAVAFGVALLSLAGAHASAQPARAPRLTISAPPGLGPVAARLRALDPARLVGVMHIIGLQEPGSPIRVRLVEESDPVARSTPAWIAGFARPAEASVVLFAARTPAYPDDSFEELVYHEVAHVLIGRASGGRPVPRWFNEGLAMTAERVWGLEDRARTAVELVRGSTATLANLEPQFGASASQAARAYALSGAFIRFLFDQYGSGVGARILAERSRGTSFNGAFLIATGRALTTVEADFWSRRVVWYRWAPFLTSSVVLWIGITLLALLAIQRHRVHNAARRRQWDELDPEPPPPDDDPPRWMH